MSDKVSLSKKAIQSIENFERVALRAIEAAKKITSHVFLYAWALWHMYRYFAGKHWQERRATTAPFPVEFNVLWTRLRQAGAAQCSSKWSIASTQNRRMTRLNWIWTM